MAMDMSAQSQLQPLIADRVPTHVITGFLGAGKTTLLKAILAQKPAGEVWAVLVNEFGQIGLDGALLEADAGIAIHEVVGGCLCCTSQLPMQVGLARLLTKTKPTRLFIEPTGLGHPLQLLEQLSEPHWARALDLRAVVCVVDGSRLGEERLTSHETYQAQLVLADIVVVSHQSDMSATDQTRLDAMLSRLGQINPVAPQVLVADQGKLGLNDIDQPRRAQRQVKRSLLHVTNSNSQPNADMAQYGSEVTLPYHYVEQALAQSVGGWRLPADWVFDRDQLLMWLLSLQGWQRIKGVIRVARQSGGGVEEGETEWLALNLIPGKISFTSHAGHTDNRLEIITQPEADWVSYEQALLTCLHRGAAA